MRPVVAAVLVSVLLGATGSDACSVLQFHWSGLGAHISGLWNALPAIYGSNGSVYLDNSEFSYMCTEGGGWHDYFQTDAGFLEPWTPALEATQSCAYYTYGEMAKASFDIGISHVQSLFDPGMVRKSWQLQPSVQKEVDAALAVLDSYAKPTIAFHVRGGDKATEDQILGRTTTKPEDLINTFLDNYVGVRGGTCVLIGDDQAAISEAEQLALKYIGCTIARPSKYYRSKGHNQASFNSLPLHDRCRETKQLIKDLEMMAHADYFVGSSTSGIPIIIATLRMTVYMKPQVTYADVSYDDMGARIRRYFGTGGFKNVSIASIKEAGIGKESIRRSMHRNMLAAASL